MMGNEMVSPDSSLTKIENVFSGWRTAACCGCEEEEDVVDADRERDMVTACRGRGQVEIGHV